MRPFLNRRSKRAERDPNPDPVTRPHTVARGRGDDRDGDDSELGKRGSVL